jgi:hypothetical protein
MVISLPFPDLPILLVLLIAASALTFDAAAHRYELDGVVVPSVTGILKASGLIDFSGIPESILEAARFRGTTVHQAIALFNEQDLDIEQFGIDFPDYVGYLEGWITFCRQRNFLSVLNEHRVASRRYQVAGTLDCLGLLDGQAVLLDYATGNPADVCKSIQTAGYQVLAHEWASEDPALAEFFRPYGHLKRYAVALRRDGSFAIEAYSAPGDAREFLALVTARQIVAKYRRERASMEFA